MKIAYFDCFAGASGDMILGSLIDAGLNLKKLEESLQKLKVSGFKISTEKTVKKGISGTRFHVHLEKNHHYRCLKDIRDIIDQSTLHKNVKEMSTAIFTRLAEAEARIHDKSINQIHFHEVGAVDSIIDIVGSTIGFHHLGIDELFCSHIHVGTGFLECSHGLLPVPPPATIELLKGIPVYSKGIENEMVTPTGAAILSTLAKTFGPLPTMRISQIGYGMGTRDLPIPNGLRLIIGETATTHDEDTIQLIETNIDDMNPQFYEHIMETLFREGAKDVFLTPIIMKKNRPGVILSVMAAPSEINKMTDLLFRETTTLGIRLSEVKKRMVLERKSGKISTMWGPVRVKVRILDVNHQTVSPEYEDCKKIAQKNKISLTHVYEEIKKEADKKPIDFLK